MKIGRLEVHIYTTNKGAVIKKHYNADVCKQIDLDEDDIYHLEFAVKEIKRQLELK